jgi:hypothetical protein
MKKIVPSFLQKKWGIVTLLLLSIVVVAATLAFAGTQALAASSNNTTYYACVNNRTGALNIVGQNDRCPGNAHKIQWSQTGSQGPATPPQAYSAFANIGANLPGGNGTVTLVTTPHLVAGTYMITASVYAQIGAGNEIGCSIHNAKGSPGLGLGYEGPVSQNMVSVVTFTDLYTVSAGDQLSVGCNKLFKTSNVVTGRTMLNAILVNTGSSGTTK